MRWVGCGSLDGGFSREGCEWTLLQCFWMGVTAREVQGASFGSLRKQSYG